MALAFASGSGGGGGGGVQSVSAGDSSIDVAGTAANPTVAVAASGVSAGTYGDGSHVSQVTVDADGRVTAAAVVAISGAGADGWIDDTTETWTYASGSGGGVATFTVPGDKTAKYTVGTRIKLTQTTAKYFVVSADPVYDGTTNTTVTIMAGSSYTLANATISLNYHSYTANPQGYPGWFTFASNASGFSSLTLDASQFSMIGRQVSVLLRVVGTSNSTNVGIDAPVAAAVSVTVAALVSDNSATVAGGVLVSAGSTSGAIALRKASVFGSVVNVAANAFTASGVKGANGAVFIYDA